MPASTTSVTPATCSQLGAWASSTSPSTVAIAGSTAIRVPNAVSVIRRSAASSSTYGSSGTSTATPIPANARVGVSPVTADHAPNGADTTAETASDAAIPRTPSTSAPTCWVSTR